MTDKAVKSSCEVWENVLIISFIHVPYYKDNIKKQDYTEIN
ncbi:hypothetical protein HMPREF3200_00760 [Anaerococcus tetradius]|uniref:Uncharacterized protein n=1 Tax=Anaerococcus tetradius TaxID=33036 RepID=A0A133KFS1_9FIRM|nr:hypothetical protein HMPREF3200_00760 [Anaerococcus tetradius]